jgi:8-oxo-dGTP pyrophosphatase MutT (NUDIX family)
MTDGGQRAATDKACPVVLRSLQSKCEILVFARPSAGHQFVKGTVEAGETPAAAALRELYEEAGITAQTITTMLGSSNAIQSGERWHFFVVQTDPLPDSINAPMTKGNCLDFSGTHYDRHYPTALSGAIKRRCTLSATSLLYQRVPKNAVKLANL